MKQERTRTGLEIALGYGAERILTEPDLEHIMHHFQVRLRRAAPLYPSASANRSAGLDCTTRRPAMEIILLWTIWATAITSPPDVVALGQLCRDTHPKGQISISQESLS